MVDKTAVNALAKEALAVLKAHFGDRVSDAGGAFSSVDATLKFRFMLGNEAEHAEALRAEFTRLAAMLGVLPSDFDLPLQVRGVPAKLAGLNLKNHTYPFVVKTCTGQTYKVNAGIFLAARVRASRATNKPA